MQANLTEFVEAFRQRGDETAYIYSRGYRKIRWSYSEVAEEACRFARELERRGIGKGEKALIWGENCAEWVVAFLGCILRGVIAVPMDRIAAPEFAARVLSQVAARICVCSKEQRVFTGITDTISFEELRQIISGNSGDPYPSMDLRPDDPVQIVFTSGTTADPKGVVITQKNILSNLAPIDSEIRKYLTYERIFHPLRFLNLLPLSHVFGQFLGMFIPRLLGATVIFQDTLNPTEIISTIKRDRVSVLIAVPRMLESLRDKIERDMEGAEKLEWFRSQYARAEGEHFVRRWWRFRHIHGQFGWKFWAFISGGATLDSSTEEFWARISFVVIQGYGLTETTSLVSVNHPFKLGRGSIGKVLPGREIKLSPTGEILVRGENIAQAYYRDREIERVQGEEGWFHTGDVGELDKDGNLYFKGRQKNVIVTPEGLNIFPEDLEAALKRQDGVRDCLVLGLAVEGNAEPCAVLLMEHQGLSPERIVRLANAGLADFQRVKRWVVWPEEDFPRTSTQKPRVSIIQDYVLARLANSSVTSAPSGSLEDLIQRVTGRPTGHLKPDSNLTTDLQLSSIDRVELISALEDRFQVDLNESKFTTATTVGELETMLRQPVTRRSDYHYPRWARGWLTSALRFIVYYLLSWPATAVMTRPRVLGGDQLTNLSGPLLIVCNHITQIDIGYILYSLPFRYRHKLAVAMLGEMLQAMQHPPAEMGFWKGIIERLSYYLVVALFNVFPLPQLTGFRRSFSYAGECADMGFSIIVFPEGRRTADGKLSPFQTGVGILARKLDLPVVPVRIDGLFELKLRGRKFARPGTVRVTIGAPIRFGADEDPEVIARDLERRVRELS